MFCAVDVDESFAGEPVDGGTAARNSAVLGELESEYFEFVDLGDAFVRFVRIEIGASGLDRQHQTRLP